MDSEPKPAQKFDEYAASYDALMADNIAASGESPDYYLNYKLDCLKRLGVRSDLPILDYGCGIGNLAAKLAVAYRSVHGYDPSAKSLEVARSKASNVVFNQTVSEVPEGCFGAAVLSGVLHHVPGRERRALIAQVSRKLTPGGRLVVFEHNPYNPVIRRAVATCPFDDDAVLLWPSEIRSLLTSAGLSQVRLDYIVFFPRQLAFLRFLEPRMRWLFLGAQTMTTALRP